MLALYKAVQGRPQIKCFNCGGRHRIKDCDKARRNKCFRCHSTDHLVANCPEPDTRPKSAQSLRRVFARQRSLAGDKGAREEGARERVAVAWKGVEVKRAEKKKEAVCEREDEAARSAVGSVRGPEERILSWEGVPGTILVASGANARVQRSGNASYSGNGNWGRRVEWMKRQRPERDGSILELDMRGGDDRDIYVGAGMCWRHWC